MDTFLNVRIPNELAARLEEHKKRTMVPTSAFVRHAVEELLASEASRQAGEIPHE